MTRDVLQTKVNNEFTKWTKEVEQTFDQSCHDQISESDKIDRHFVLRYILRWTLEELSDHVTPVQMEDIFMNIYYQLAGQRLCTERFNSEMGKAINKFEKGRKP